MSTLTFVELENETSISILELEKMNVLKLNFAFFSARYTIKFTEQKWNKFINELWHINLYINISISNWHNSIFSSTKMNYLVYFSSVHDYWPPTTLMKLVYNSLGEMEWCEKRAFQLLKMRKMKISWNIKTKCVTDFLLTVRSTSMKDYTCHYVVSTKKTNVYINLIKFLWILKLRKNLIFFA